MKKPLFFLCDGADLAFCKETFTDDGVVPDTVDEVAVLVSHG